MKINISIFCFGIYFSFTHFILSQNFPSGVYTDVANSEKNLIFYSLNGINYVIQKDYDFYFDDIVIRETLTHGLVRNENELNYTCGPFASFCRDGYFIEKNGENYYYDELTAAYEANTYEDPLDTLNYLYVKVGELPTDWKLTPDDRTGEFGVISESIVYDISIIRNIKKINTSEIVNSIIIECDIAYENETKKYIMKETDFLNLEITKSADFQITDLIGKTVQLYFKWEHGRIPGILSDDDFNIESIKYSTPYDITLLDKDMNSKTEFNYPKPKN
ncbi:MAG: hypothetical protein ACKO7D_09350 [Bacteroidota bacterium]